MNRLGLLSMAAMASMMAFTACDKPAQADDTDTTEPEGIEQTDMVEAYYVGDYYEAGTGNGWINFINGDLVLDEETEEYTGNGMILCVDINMALPSSPDFVSLEEGTYTICTDGTYPAKTWNANESYITLRKNDVTQLEAGITGGTFTVKHVKSGYNIVFDLDVNGEKFQHEFTGKISFINHSDEGAQSNLESDVTVSGLTQGAMIYMGDVAMAEVADTYMVVLADDDYDLESNFGTGKSVLLYLNVPMGNDYELPAGRYKDFVCLEEAEAPAWTGLQGMYYWGTYIGSYYFHYTEQIEARIVDGDVTVDKTGDTYEINGVLKDGNGKKVSFSYTGELLYGELAENYSLTPGRAAKSIKQ